MLESGLRISCAMLAVSLPRATSFICCAWARMRLASSINTTVGAGQGGESETVSHSGTYAIDESQKTLTLHIEQSTLPFLPNWAGTTQIQPIKFLIGDDLGWTNQKALTPSSDFVGTELIWRRAK